MTDLKGLKVTLVKGLGGRTAKQRACVTGLGLRRLNSSRVLDDSPAVRGMINRISFMLRVEEIQR